jgi:sugar phosphate isomerase/epimerase
MRLGLGSYTYPWSIGIRDRRPANPVDQLGLLDRAIRHGATVVQYCENLPLLALPKTSLEFLAAKAKDHGISIEVGTRGTDAAELLSYRDLAASIGATFVRVAIDKGSDEPSFDEALARLKPIVQQFHGSGVKLAIENQDRFSSRSLKHMIEALGPEDAAVCLDTANSLGSLEGLDTVVRELGPYTVNLHIKDIRIKRPWHAMGFEVFGTAAGDGQVDIVQLVSTLLTWGASFSVVLEHWPGFQDDIETLALQEEAWTERGMAFLRAALAPLPW